ncbi:Swi SNF matrix associated, actin dependent regulator of chromatin [Bulinus truncatus]|nr:Swi SNF matrix associated, actin dependent regulator of chromatin [Bulinus truncatus]
MDEPRKYEYEKEIMAKLPNKLYEKLMPFQREGVLYAIRKNGRYFNDRMGLGKTLQAISVAYYYRDEWPLLIIVPSSLKFCWIEELEKWLPNVLPHQINLVHCGSDASGIADSLITIVTYGLLRLPSSKILREAIEACRFKIIICDESHYLKNLKSLSCKTIVPLIKSAERRILLSGTPALAKPAELYPQIDAVCPKKFGTFWQFAARYCDSRTVYFGKFRKQSFDGASNLEELQKLLIDILMIRREKSQVLTELPPKQRQRVLFELKDSPLKKEILDKFVELKKKIHQGYKEVKNIFLDSEKTIDNSSQQLSTFSQISELYKLSGNAKIGPVREYIEMLCDNERLKFLVFAYHHDMMNGVEQVLWEKNVKFVRIDGNTKSVDRQQYVTQFQSDSETRVAILSILAAGVGLTFTAAKLVVFAELYWTPGVMMQCEDRAHRIGQTCSLPVHYLVARGTMDEWVWSAVCKKTVVTSTALSGETRKLELDEGDQYQIDLLSNADMWRPEEDSSQLDISDIVLNSRPSDQSSILQFFTPTKADELKPCRKRKLEEMGLNLKCKVGKLNAGTKKGQNYSEILVISDDDDDFTSQSLKSKLISKKMKFSECHAAENEHGQKKDLNKITGVHVENICVINKYEGKEKIHEASQEAGLVTPLSTSKKLKTEYASDNSKFFCGDGEVEKYDSKNGDNRMHWACVVCTFENHVALGQCEMCDTPRKNKSGNSSNSLGEISQRKSPISSDSERVFPSPNESSILTEVQRPSHDPDIEPSLPTSSNHLENSVVQEKSCSDVYKCLMFSCSVYTGRIYVYNEAGTSLEASFLPIDIEMGNLSELPSFLQLPANLRLLQKFVREWSSLTETKKRIISKKGQKFVSPLVAYSEVKTVLGNKQRHLTKMDIMESALKKAKVGLGTVRVISKQSSVPSEFRSETSEGLPVKGLLQTVTDEGVPLCLQCQNPYSNPLLSSTTVSDPANAWQLRLCSHACMDKYWTITKASYCRDQIYEIEQGVCRLCQFDADKLYSRIKATQGVKARLNLINNSPYAGFTAKQRQKMVENPQAGQFWHVDHITPVWQGGGMCDLDNLRTLCTPCHLRITQKQAGERASIKKLSGACNTRDITAFFQKL